MGFPCRWRPFPRILNWYQDTGTPPPRALSFLAPRRRPAYQLALRMPGSSPVNASWRKQIRQIPK